MRNLPAQGFSRRGDQSDILLAFGDTALSVTLTTIISLLSHSPFYRGFHGARAFYRAHCPRRLRNYHDAGDHRDGYEQSVADLRP
jgi:hypothetical protein